MRQSFFLLLCIALSVGCVDDVATVPDAGNPADQCVSSSDQAIFAPYLADGGMGFTSELDDLIRMCAQDQCASQLLGNDVAAAEDCMAGCYATTVLAGLSRGCQDCLTRASMCAGRNCTTPCLGTDRALCSACVDEYCSPQRDYCTGL